MSLVQPPAKPAASGSTVLVPRQPPQLTGTDREFLPAALEILVTPPSPVAKSLLLAICALFFAALVWSYFGWIDIYAVAPGKIQPDGGSKVLQPVDAGKVVVVRGDRSVLHRIEDSFEPASHASVNVAAPVSR